MVLRKPRESKACRDLCIHPKKTLDPRCTKGLKEEGYIRCAFTTVTGVCSQEAARKTLLEVQVACDSGFASGQMMLREV